MSGVRSALLWPLALLWRLNVRLRAPLARREWHSASLGECDGFPVAVANHAKAELLRTSVGRALALIRRVHPRQYARLRHDLRGILVVQGRGLNGLSEENRICCLTERNVTRSSVAVTAGSIVHEAAHARLAASGIPYAPGVMKRCEAYCFRAQIAFAKRLPRDEFSFVDDWVAYLQRWIGVWPSPSAAFREYRRPTPHRPQLPAA